MAYLENKGMLIGLKTITGLNSGLHDIQNGHLIRVKLRWKHYMGAIWSSFGPALCHVTLRSQERDDPPSRERRV